MHVFINVSSVQMAQGGVLSSFHFEITYTHNLALVDDCTFPWMIRCNKHCRALIFGKPRLCRIIIFFAPPAFFVCVYVCGGV